MTFVTLLDKEITDLENAGDKLATERTGDLHIIAHGAGNIRREIEKQAASIKAEFQASKPLLGERWTPRGTGFAIVVVTEDTPFSFYARIISTDENFSGRSLGVTQQQGQITQAMRDEVIAKLEKIAKRAVQV